MSEFSRLRGNEGYGACDDVGHADNEFNNRCDELAVMESKKFKGSDSAESTEKINRKKEQNMAGKFKIAETKNGGFKFNLTAANGQVIATSQTYTTLDGCKAGIESVRKNCGAHVEDQTKEGFQELTHPKYEVYQDKAGEFRFRLKAKNGEIILTGEGYKAKDSCLNGIESIGKNAPEAEIVNEE